MRQIGVRLSVEQSFALQKEVMHYVMHYVIHK